jgi:LuxR family transcriptional regulator, quorum-sensing system regulator BjaR1
MIWRQHRFVIHPENWYARRLGFPFNGVGFPARQGERRSGSRVLSLASDVESFIQGLDGLAPLAGLETAFLALVRKHGFCTLAYYRLYAGGRPYARTFMFGERRQPWLDRYNIGDHAGRDPRNAMAFRTSAAFTWDEALEAACLPGAKAVMQEVRHVATVDGLVTPVRSGVDELGVCILYSDHPVRCSAYERLLLQGVCEAFVRRGLQLLDGDDGPPRLPVVTAREAQCLHWVAAGYSDQEIATALRRSFNTVHTHVESLRSKFRARSRAHLVFKAAMAGVVPVAAGEVSAPAAPAYAEP